MLVMLQVRILVQKTKSLRNKINNEICTKQSTANISTIRFITFSVQILKQI